MHRVEYVQLLLNAELSPFRADPVSDLFYPLKAAILSIRQGELDEAAWLVFLLTHFGHHRRGGWAYARAVYGRLGEGTWDWVAVSAEPYGFAAWMTENAGKIRAENQGAGFGNHRKFESLARSGEVAASYIDWVVRGGGHVALFNNALDRVTRAPRDAFAFLYADMRANVRYFGRLACFDYLAMIGKLGIAEIEPDSPHLAGSTGPIAGAKELFGTPDATAHSLDQWIIHLGSDLGVNMQVMEDALCNWQKSPEVYQAFNG